MKNDDREREFRLRPPKPRRNPADETRIWSIAFKRVMHIARMSGARRGPDGSKRVAQSSRFQQRCAVRITYSKNKGPGQWKAHGRYIARESATHEEARGHEGFGRTADGIPIDATLHQWQLAGDRRLFKLIVSPEFGDRLDLKKLVRNLMSEMERDLGTKLEWVAAEHHNTEYPHVHIALRGIDDKGRTLQLPREYVQYGIRKNAERLATVQIGYRTARDAESAQRREVHQKRYTSLDRIIRSTSTSTSDGQEFAVDVTKRRSKTEQCILNARLLFLQKMGLAGAKKSNQWLVRSDFETILRAMQRTDDRQRSLAAHAALVSDPRLPSRLTDVREVQQLEGRVLGHGEEESSGRTYMMLEGTDHQVHFIYRSPELEAARRQGKLNANSFVRLRTRLVGQKFITNVQYYGDSNQLLSNKHFFRSSAQRLIKGGISPIENRTGGWLGKYETRLSQAFHDAQRQLAKSGRKNR